MIECLTPSAEQAGAVDVIIANPGGRIGTLEGGFTYIATQDPEQVLPRIINTLTKNGCHIQRVETTKSSLEDVFLSLTGKGINE